MIEMVKSICSCNFCTAICSVFWCADVVLFMYSTSGNQSSYILNGAFSADGGLSMGAVANERMDEARAAADDAAPVVPNVLDDALPAGGSLSMGVVVNSKMNEARDSAYAAAPVVPNVLNYVLAAGGRLSMGVVENTKMNEALSDTDAAAPAASDTTNAPAAEDTAYALAAAYTSNVPAAETPQIRRHFVYFRQILMADKDCFWHQHENIPPNVIGAFENDIMYGRVVYVPRLIANKFEYTIEWDMPCLPDGFTIAWYTLCTSVANTHSPKIHLQLAINRAKTGNHTFI